MRNVNGFSRRTLALTAGVVLMLSAIAGTAVAQRSGSDWIGPDGRENAATAPDFLGVADESGRPARCADGGLVRVPLSGIPADVPVFDATGKAYPSMAAAQESTNQRIANGDINVTGNTNSGQVVHLGAEDVFRPSVSALCERFGSEK